MARLMLARRLMLVGSALTLAAAIGARVSARPGAAPLAVQLSASPCADARDHDLPLPTSLSPDAFHDRLLAFLQNTRIREAELVRRQGRPRYGAVRQRHVSRHASGGRVYYSPAVMKWLVNGREGDLPDGAMIVKEMYCPPAASWEGTAAAPASWTVMIKDAKGSKDGWFWGGLGRALRRCRNRATASNRRSLCSTKVSACRVCTATLPRKRN